MDTTLERLKEFWSKQQIKLRPGLPHESIEKFERKLQVRFPDELKSYFLFANGFEGPMDNEHISFFPIEEAIEESISWIPTEYPGFRFFAFADFLIASHVYVIDLGSSGPLYGSIHVVYNNKPEFIRRVADSFYAFLEGYMASDYAVLFPE